MIASNRVIAKWPGCGVMSGMDAKEQAAFWAAAAAAEKKIASWPDWKRDAAAAQLKVSDSSLPRPQSKSPQSR